MISNYKVIIGILAAGTSSRLGSPKQLMQLGTRTLLENVIRSSEQSHADETVIVTGYKRKEILESIDEYRFLELFNENFRNGMASSIVPLVKYSIKNKVEALILSVCDQPELNKHIFNKLIAAHSEKNDQVVFSKYQNGFGVPVLIPKKFFEYMLSIKGDKGAKDILQKMPYTTIEFKEGDIDIDTIESLNKYLSVKNM